MPEPKTWRFVPFRKDIVRRDFSCGKAPLDRFFKEQAGQNEGQGLRTFVAIPASGGTKALGYVSLCAYQVAFESVPAHATKRLPKHYPIPAILIARLAVDSAVRGQGLGSDLLLHALLQIWRASKRVGLNLVIVHAKDDAAVSFYRHFGFELLEREEPNALFMPIASIRDLFS